MRYLEIRQGLTIKMSEVEAIEKKDEITTSIYTKNRSYETNIPYEALKDIIQSGNDGNEQQNNINGAILSNLLQANKSLNVLEKSSQYFGG